MIRLTQLKIDRFRNVKPGTLLQFGPTFNVLLGKNATGKSTLLELIAAVTHDDLSPFANEEGGFDLTWWLELDENQLEIHAVRTPARPWPGLAASLREEREFDDSLNMVMRVAGVETWQLALTGAHVIWKLSGHVEESFEIRPGLAVRQSTLRALWRVSEKQGVESLAVATRMRPLYFAAGRFDEALRAFDAIVGMDFDLIRDGNSTHFFYGAWLPFDFDEAVVDVPSDSQLVISFDKVPSLSNVPALLGFQSGEMRPRLSTSSQDGDRTTTYYRGCDFLFRRTDSSAISHQFLSFGQKRLFSFLWYLALHEAPEGIASIGVFEPPIVADELLNGLHHEWIEVCFDHLQNRQSFLSTQHPLLLDHIPVESAEGVLKTFVRCTLETDPNGREQLAWRNFDEAEAERFFTAHQTGIQQVSEVLRTEGLW